MRPVLAVMPSSCHPFHPLTRCQHFGWAGPLLCVCIWVFTVCVCVCVSGSLQCVCVYLGLYNVCVCIWVFTMCVCVYLGLYNVCVCVCVCVSGSSQCVCVYVTGSLQCVCVFSVFPPMEFRFVLVFGLLGCHFPQLLLDIRDLRSAVSPPDSRRGFPAHPPFSSFITLPGTLDPLSTFELSNIQSSK